eukprot:2003891-Alexandrium_andersonii.AAC.1
MTQFSDEVADLLLNAALALHVEEDGGPSRLCALCLSNQLLNGWRIQLVHNVSQRKNPRMVGDSCVPVYDACTILGT